MGASIGEKRTGGGMERVVMVRFVQVQKASDTCSKIRRGSDQTSICLKRPLENCRCRNIGKLLWNTSGMDAIIAGRICCAERPWSRRKLCCLSHHFTPTTLLTIAMVLSWNAACETLTALRL